MQSVDSGQRAISPAHGVAKEMALYLSRDYYSPGFYVEDVPPTAESVPDVSGAV